VSYKQKPVKEPEVTFSPRVKLLQDAYDRAGLEYVIKSEDRNEAAFLDAVQRRPDTHRQYVKSIYRLKTEKRFVVGNESDEALIYWMDEAVLDFSDRNMDLGSYKGYWWNINARMNKDLQGNTAKVQVLNEFPVFQIPFSAENVDKIMGYSLNDVNQFYVGTATDRGPNIQSGDLYQILNKEDFKNATFQELMDMGRYNFSAKEPRLTKWREEGETIIKQSQTITSLTTSNRQANKR
jgi:hypothetical protein